MKKGIYVPLSCAILTVAALSGCSTTNKIPDATIENAIQDSTNIYSDYGLSIQQLSFDSRNYDKQEKTEAVTVTVNADNADTSYTATYDVLGKLSDKSWRIVSVTQTSEEIKPKNALSYVIAAGVFIAAGFFNASVLLLIVLCALLGLFFSLRKRGERR